MARRWLIVCGGGNNGGDGYVIATLALAAGISAQVAAILDPSRLKGDAASSHQQYQRAGGVPLPFDAEYCNAADLIVDALFGTGLAREVSGEYRRIILAMNDAPAPKVAIDVPSGLDAARGMALGVAVRANLTVTFVARKVGMYIGEGPDYVGEVCFSDLALPPDIAARFHAAGQLFGDTDSRELLPRRPRTAHKGAFGHVLVAGGNIGMGGAVRLAAEAALRSGAGLVTVATRRENVAAVTGYRPELMSWPVETPADLDPVLTRATIIAVGPGLGQDEWAHGILSRILSSTLPLVVDADALNLLAMKPTQRRDWILTPHPGEAGRLLGISSAQVQADRPAAAAALSGKFGATVLLKGRATLVAAVDGTPWFVDCGNPGMATGGMGDVLTGIVAGLRAQFSHADVCAITALAAWVHARAGDAAAGSGERGLTAGDVVEHLRPWLNPGS